MNARAPFTVIPWNTEFLPALLDRALDETDGDIGRASFIFPHSRPARYLALLLHRREGVRKPLMLPRMHTVSSLCSLISGRSLARPAWNAGLLDRVGLLLQCAREEAKEEARKETAREETFSLAEPKRFFPWGVRLASLFEECFSQCRRPHDFIHLEGQVTPYARALLERLGRIFSRYETGLAEREWTTPGHDAYVAAASIKRADALPPGIFTPGAPVFIAGFHALTGAEDTLFRHLWERGGSVALHADPALADGKGHWSCRALADWARAWNARLDVFSHGDENSGSDGVALPVIRYVAGYDLHSQLAELGKELDSEPRVTLPVSTEDGPCAVTMAGADHPDKDRDADSNTEQTDFLGIDGIQPLPAVDRLADTAVILPDSGLLLPVLHHLPRADVNISMGYPLARSPLFRLIDTLLRLQERRRGRGYYWRDLVELLRHPYVKMLRHEPDRTENPAGNRTGDETSAHPDDHTSSQTTNRTGNANATDSPPAGEELRRELHVLERALRQRGGKYIDPRAFLMDEYQQREQEAMPGASVLGFLESLLATALDAFERPGTPGELAACLDALCELLLGHGGHLWPHFPIDAECMYRLRRSLIPELARSALADEPLERETLFSLLRSLMEAERVPFEADPLVGMQVMGMLESRLLSFRRVIVADAVESALPGSGQGDPLLPEALRPELGLPSLHGREQVAAYHFFRLIRSADEVVLLWREGGDAPGEGGKSRFIEELLWQEEQRRGRLFEAGRDDPPLRAVPALVSPIARQRRALPVTPEIRRLLRAALARPVSASLLDAYLNCPLRFFYERAAGLAPADEVGEGDDPLAVGDMMHLVLHDVYANLLAKPLPGEEALEAMLGEELLAAFAASPELARIGRSIPADSFAMLVTAGKKRLTEYLLAQPPTTPLALEQPLTADFSFANSLSGAGSLSGTFAVRLFGKADRIDLRAGPPGSKTAGTGGADTDAANKDTASKDASGKDAARPEPYRVILDYKTGRIPRLAPDIWERTALWDAMDAWTPEAVNTDLAGHSGAAGDSDAGGHKGVLPDAACPVLFSLAEGIESVQLPFYLLLHQLAGEQNTLHADAPPPDGPVPDAPGPDIPGSGAFGPKEAGQGVSGSPVPALDARWVSLGDRGREHSLFPAAMSHEERQEIIADKFPRLVRFLLRHMAETPILLPRPGKRCDWCSSAKLCMVSAVPAVLPPV